MDGKKQPVALHTSRPCRYWANLKLWFKQKISKEEFDLEAHRLLTQDNGKTATFCNKLVFSLKK